MYKRNTCYTCRYYGTPNPLVQRSSRCAPAKKTPAKRKFGRRFALYILMYNVVFWGILRGLFGHFVDTNGHLRIYSISCRFYHIIGDMSVDVHSDSNIGMT